MESAEMIAIVVVLTSFVGFFYLTYWIIKRSVVNTKKEWAVLARTLELELNLPEGRFSWFLGKFPTIEGELKGIHFYCFMYTRGSGKHQKTYTCFRLNTKASDNHDFQVYKEGFFSKIGKAFGGQDIQFGHENFDQNYIIKGTNEHYVKQVINSKIRQLMLQKLPNMVGTFSLENGVLEYNAIILLNNAKNRKAWENAIYVGLEMVKEINK